MRYSLLGSSLIHKAGFLALLFIVNRDSFFGISLLKRLELAKDFSIRLLFASSSLSSTQLRSMLSVQDKYLLSFFWKVFLNLLRQLTLILLSVFFSMKTW